MATDLDKSKMFEQLNMSPVSEEEIGARIKSYSDEEQRKTLPGQWDPKDQSVPPHRRVKRDIETMSNIGPLTPKQELEISPQSDEEQYQLSQAAKEVNPLSVGGGILQGALQLPGAMMTLPKYVTDAVRKAVPMGEGKGLLSTYITDPLATAGEASMQGYQDLFNLGGKDNAGREFGRTAFQTSISAPYIAANEVARQLGEALPEADPAIQAALALSMFALPGKKGKGLDVKALYELEQSRGKWKSTGLREPTNPKAPGGGGGIPVEGKNWAVGEAKGGPLLNEYLAKLSDQFGKNTVNVVQGYAKANNIPVEQAAKVLVDKFAPKDVGAAAAFVGQRVTPETAGKIGMTQGLATWEVTLMNGTKIEVPGVKSKFEAFNKAKEIAEKQGIKSQPAAANVKVGQAVFGKGTVGAAEVKSNLPPELQKLKADIEQANAPGRGGLQDLTGKEVEIIGEPGKKYSIINQDPKTGKTTLAEIANPNNLREVDLGKFGPAKEVGELPPLRPKGTGMNEVVPEATGRFGVDPKLEAEMWKYGLEELGEEVAPHQRVLKKGKPFEQPGGPPPGSRPTGAKAIKDTVASDTGKLLAKDIEAVNNWSNRWGGKGAAELTEYDLVRSHTAAKRLLKDLYGDLKTDPVASKKIAVLLNELNNLDPKFLKGKKEFTKLEEVSEYIHELLRKRMTQRLESMGLDKVAKDKVLTELYKSMSKEDSAWWKGYMAEGESVVGRQKGGDIKKGQVAVVGENGPELIIRTEKGDIEVIPLSQAIAAPYDPNNALSTGKIGPGGYLPGQFVEQKGLAKLGHPEPDNYIPSLESAPGVPKKIKPGERFDTHSAEDYVKRCEWWLKSNLAY